MRLSARRLAMFVLIGLLIAAFATGCTLAGANAAPLTPVASGQQSAGGEVTVESGAGDTVPTPTEMAPIDFFGTQTAEAPPPEPTEEPTQESTGGEIVEQPTEEPTQEPVETAESAETQAPVDTSGAGGGSTASCPATHTVQSGENLFRIALKYNLSTQQLASANGISNADQLLAGTVLNIPGCGGSAATSGGSTGATGSTGSGSTYTVQAGDNLFRIALKYNLSWQQLAQANGITNPDNIVVGQVLNIP
jgi:LysM repeat protein